MSASQYPVPPLEVTCYRHAERVDALGQTQALVYQNEQGQIIRRHPDGREEVIEATAEPPR
jgi:hypothetical protein